MSESEPGGAKKSVSGQVMALLGLCGHVRQARTGTAKRHHLSRSRLAGLVRTPCAARRTWVTAWMSALLSSSSRATSMCPLKADRIKAVPPGCARGQCGGHVRTFSSHSRRLCPAPLEPSPRRGLARVAEGLAGHGDMCAE
jgi:hypothetical protein